MTHRRSARWFSRGVVTAMLGALLVSALPATAAPWSNQYGFANESFQNLWNETDAFPGNRSLTWGPRPWWDYREFYRQSPGGLRQVQYFDKSRMEINNPNAARTRFFVTNGLLPVEMISGRLKLGDANSEDQYEQRPAAQIPVAGDLAKVNPDAPTYASFRLVATTSGNNRAEPRLGERINTTFDKNGNIGARQELATAGTEIVQFNANTGHNVPAIFRNYMDFYDRAGGVGSLFAFGYPITEPYWIRARVAGQEKDILVQIYERRVLTYTPSNPEQFQVEMGNVGQHYFQWRYPNQGTPWAPDTQPYFPVAFASNRNPSGSGAPIGHLETYTTDANGNSQNPITSGGSESRPHSIMRSWEQKEIRIIGDSTRVAPGKRQLFSFALDGSEARRLHTSTANDYNGAVSPDGTKIAFVSDRDGNPEIFLMNINGGAVAQLTSTTVTTDTKKACSNEYPTWYPDGRGLVFSSDCFAGNNWEVVRADLSYTQDKGNDLKATLGTLTNLSRNAGADRYPRISPDGTKIAFATNRDGNFELYVMGFTGGAVQRLTTSTRGNDVAPTWSPDGTQVIYQSDIEGVNDNEIYIRTLDPAAAPRQLTNNGADDMWPIWAQ